MLSGAESLDTIATWWQEVSTLSSLPKHHPGLKVRQAKNRVPTAPGKPGKMTTVFPVLESIRIL